MTGSQLLFFGSNFAGDFECSVEALIIAAMTQIQNVFVVPPNQKLQAVSIHDL